MKNTIGYAKILNFFIYLVQQGTQSDCNCNRSVYQILDIVIHRTKVQGYRILFFYLLFRLRMLPNMSTSAANDPMTHLNAN